ncbi:MAG: lipopolysaccharide biosynthesis protein [Oscillatoriophycideae cyanobacterium NC_groundwater_1537_Pr4_S-0.65um_50_18]|nr:lipopolysaccharide biosynthesis protein [Oscillatoriophycideae cyanobacterium NC_groundwater_1537_Pr4_S-0.65um_50_18]
MIFTQIKHKLSNRFIRNAGWLGSAELANRVFRLGTTVVLARTFSPQDYGLVAIIITANEFANVFTCKAGIGSKLVQAPEKELDSLCETAYWMSWIASVLIFISQCLTALLVGWFYKDSRLILPICALAVSHLMLPLFTVQISLIERENRLNIIALCNGLQSVLINILTVFFALLGWGIWSVILALVLTMPVWVIINRANCSWHPKTSFTLHRWQEIASYAVNIIGSDLLVKLRDNLDYLLVGRFLGLELLGIYYFAFNAGLGISLSVINSLTWSLWPHLCAARESLRDLRYRYFGGLKTIACVIIPMVLLQSSLAPFYVPIIFGSKWVSAIPILIVVCLSAIPRPFFLAATQLLNAVDRTHKSLQWGILLTVVYTAAILVSVQHGIFAVAISVLASQFLVTPIFMAWTTKYVFKPVS